MKFFSAGRFVLVLSIALLSPLVFAQSPKQPDTPSIDGAWIGTLDVGGEKLRLQFVISNTANDFKATLYSLDQSGHGITASAVHIKEDHLTIDVGSIDGSYTGKLTADKNNINGTWTQGGTSFPLALTRSTPPAQDTPPKRPQNPVRPYPYTDTDVTYPGNMPGNILAGTLTVPPGKGPFPAVLLISGSGPNTRNENVLGHKLFLVLSDYLTRKGIVVLRVDKRGINKSTGDYKSATTADFADDADSGVAFLKSRPEVDPHKIGLIGHSEGGDVAPIVAARNKDVAFIVMLAGPGVPGDKVIVEQTRLINQAQGMSKENADMVATQQQSILALIESEKDEQKLKADLLDLKISINDEQLAPMLTPWYRYFLTFDPAIALRQVKCPVLALNGSKDLQVPPAQNLPPIRKALTDGGNQHFEVDELPGLNHLFQTATTGSPSEYGQIEETMSPVALDKIASWILKQ